jgi:hypothetical protein
MKSTAKKQTAKGGARPVFDSLRKPNAPPGHPLTRAKPEARAHPAERKAKHKRPVPFDGD